MTLSIRQVGPCFAGEVSGIDLTQPLGLDDIAAIHDGMAPPIPSGTSHWVTPVWELM